MSSLLVAAMLAGCKKKEPAPSSAAVDAGVFYKPVDHLGASEIVGSRETIQGLPVPKGFALGDLAVDEGLATGRASFEEMRRYVLENTMNCLARPEARELVWWDCEIPGRGATRFHIRVSRNSADDESKEVTLMVREQTPRAAFDGGSGEVLKAMGLDPRGYPTDYERLR